MNLNPLDIKQIIAALLDAETFGTVLHAAVLSLYPEVHELDSLELYARLQDDYGVTMPEENENKLQAIIAAITTTYFYHDVEVFVEVCRTLNSGAPGLEEFDLDDISPAECLWGIYEISLNDDDRVDYGFSKAIHKHIDQVMKNEGHEDDQEGSALTNALVMNSLELKKQLELLGFKNVVLPPVTE